MEGKDTYHDDSNKCNALWIDWNEVELKCRTCFLCRHSSGAGNLICRFAKIQMVDIILDLDITCSCFRHRDICGLRFLSILYSHSPSHILPAALIGRLSRCLVASGRYLHRPGRRPTIEAPAHHGVKGHDLQEREYEFDAVLH